MIGDPSVAVLLGHQESIPELPQGLFAEHGGQEETVGLEHAPDLGQHARQVVDPVQRQVGDDQIEGALLKGDQLLVGHHALRFDCAHDTHTRHTRRDRLRHVRAKTGQSTCAFTMKGNALARSASKCWSRARLSAVWSSKAVSDQVLPVRACVRACGTNGRTRGVELYNPLDAGDLLQVLGHTGRSPAQGQHRRELSLQHVLLCHRPALLAACARRRRRWRTLRRSARRAAISFLR